VRQDEQRQYSNRLENATQIARRKEQITHMTSQKRPMNLVDPSTQFLLGPETCPFPKANSNDEAAVEENHSAVAGSMSLNLTRIRGPCLLASVKSILPPSAFIEKTFRESRDISSSPITSGRDKGSGYQIVHLATYRGYEACD
jgi:hypothetical protein